MIYYIEIPLPGSQLSRVLLTSPIHLISPTSHFAYFRCISLTLPTFCVTLPTQRNLLIFIMTKYF